MAEPAEVFVYMGEGADVPMDVVRARVHPSVTRIPNAAFANRTELEEVELCEGLQEIGRGAFQYCYSFNGVVIPSTVKIIGSHAFHCAPMVSINLHDDITSIGAFSFVGSKFTKVRTPPLVETIQKGLFSGCSCMSVELPETIFQIDRYAFNGCFSLRNIAIPPNCEVAVDSFRSEWTWDTNLRQRFGSEMQLVNALKHRFDGLQIHKMLYYHSYQAVTVEGLINATNMRSTTSQRALRRKLDPTGRQQDCLGMNPLHILACSTVQDLSLYKELIDRYPENLVTEDMWGASPLLYAVWGNAPSEIVQFLVESCKSIYPGHEFDWNMMFEALGRANASFGAIQKLCDLQQDHFTEQNVDWMGSNGVLITLIRKSSTADASFKTLKFMTKCSIAKRVDAIGVKQWRSKILTSLEEAGTNNSDGKQRWLTKVKNQLAHHESEYQTLKEATTILELALWKHKISASDINQETMRSAKRIKVDESGFRLECRINCGADHVIQNVLLYLLPSSN